MIEGSNSINYLRSTDAAVFEDLLISFCSIVESGLTFKDNYQNNVCWDQSSHGSSSSCLADLRSSGTHFSIDLRK